MKLFMPSYGFDKRLQWTLNRMPRQVIFGFLTVISQPVHGASRRDRRAESSSDNHAKVLILGAGASGLQASRILHDAGMDDFIIIEGADQIGGRVQSTTFANRTIELGAGWTYGPVRPTVHQLAKDINLDRRTNDYDSITIRNDTGNNVTDQAFGDYNKFEPAMEKLFSLKARIQNKKSNPDMSQRSALRLGGWSPKSDTEKLIEWFDIEFQFAESTEVLSASEAEDFGETQFLKDPRGFKAIFDVVAGFLKEPEFINHTRLNQRVVSIDQSDPASVVVTCEDGTVYTADQVLVTFSLGVLQNDLVKFIPPLPEWKDVVIKKSLIAAYTHIYLSFPTKFWDDTEWILHASPKKGYHPAFFNFQAEGYDPDGTPTLLDTLTGDESRRVEAQPVSQTKAEIEQVLRNMYGDSIPDIEDILISGWTSNPLTMGSYSTWPTELSRQCTDALEGRVDRVFFGGEATSAVHYGYVEGGLDSGKREGLKILDCMQNFEECPFKRFPRFGECFTIRPMQMETE
ncbi:polyamine oxidase 7-like [Asterias rubens]|uniref:polyamine oxidase 7-like n=1 Tax=Asterias rubens TaxID=7604 RepID=UPI00145537F4|nr:polyamine oxidase 7-like [Asterias rubens]